MRTVLGGILILTLLGIRGYAGDPTGMWKASYVMPDGTPHESVFDLKVNDGKITGTITSKRGSVPISDGAVKGNSVFFTVIRKGNGDELTVQFSGKIEGDTMTLKMTYRDHDPVQLTARRSEER